MDSGTKGWATLACGIGGGRSQFGRSDRHSGTLGILKIPLRVALAESGRGNLRLRERGKGGWDIPRRLLAAV
jgi:hypothetical protein